jgi:hypothetical protein
VFGFGGCCCCCCCCCCCFHLMHLPLPYRSCMRWTSLRASLPALDNVALRSEIKVVEPQRVVVLSISDDNASMRVSIHMDSMDESQKRLDSYIYIYILYWVVSHGIETTKLDRMQYYPWLLVSFYSRYNSQK